MLQILGQPDQLSGLRADWDRLARRFASPFLSFDWLATCAQIGAPAERTMVLVSRDAGGAVEAIAPLVETTTARGATLEILGATRLGEPSGLLYTDEDALQHLFDGIVDLGLPVALRRLHANSAEARLAQRLSKTRALSTLWSGGDSPWLPIAGTWEAYQTNLSTGRRTDLRRKRRRAERRGAVAIDFTAPAPDRLPPLLATAFQIEASSWKSDAGTAILQNPAVQRFFTTYATIAAGQGKLHVGFMSIGGQPVAMLIGVVEHDAFWALKMGYDRGYADCSPGTLLNHASLEYCFGLGLGRYEFCGWSEPWQSSFTDRTHPYVSAALYPLSARGLRALGADLPRVAIRRLRSFIRPA